MLTLTATARTGNAPLSVECYDAERNPLTPSSRRADGISVPVLENGEYFVKLSGSGFSAPVPYALSATMYADPAALSGADRTPFGAKTLVTGMAVEDTVSFDRGDKIDWWRLAFGTTGRIGIEMDTRRN
ncbi:MAG: hypothetical protein FJY97_09920 [candidate division Zixibacteria bacterium]|nr:hypothetical protein [candidate division Zixibacteria bacterium]